MIDVGRRFYILATLITMFVGSEVQRLEDRRRERIGIFHISRPA
jgi:hypothetical protein